MMIIKNPRLEDSQWVLEYSAKQDQFHISPLYDSLLWHREMCEGRQDTGWETVAIATYQEVSDYQDQLMANQDKKRRAKA